MENNAGDRAKHRGHRAKGLGLRVEDRRQISKDRGLKIKAEFSYWLPVNSLKELVDSFG